MTPAMTRALDLHTPKGQLPSNPDEDQTAAFRKANQLRASLLDDSWPRKIAAFRRLYTLSQHDNPMPADLRADRESLHGFMFIEEVCEIFGLDQDQARQVYNFIIELSPGPVSLADKADGILDAVVVGLGWLCEHGFKPQQIEQMMEEIHASNMTKTDDHGQPVFDTNGKVLKGDNYVPVALGKMVTAFSVGISASDIDHLPAQKELPLGNS